jgi:hypothetical protein
MLVAGCYLGLIFDPEGKGSMFLQNASELLLAHKMVFFTLLLLYKHQLVNGVQENNLRLS